MHYPARWTPTRCDGAAVPDLKVLPFFKKKLALSIRFLLLYTFLTSKFSHNKYKALDLIVKKILPLRCCWTSTVVVMLCDALIQVCEGSRRRRCCLCRFVVEDSVVLGYWFLSYSYVTGVWVFEFVICLQVLDYQFSAVCVWVCLCAAGCIYMVRLRL